MKRKKNRKKLPAGHLQLIISINCGKCGCFSEVHLPGEFKSVALMEAYLHEKGWVLTKKYGWACSACGDAKPNRKTKTKRKAGKL